MTSRLARKAFFFFLVLELFPLVGPRAGAQDQPTNATAQDRPTAPDTQPRGRRTPSLDDQLKTLTDRLNLDATQQGMVKVILEHRQSELLDVYKNQSLSAVDRFNAMKAVHERANDRISRILNPEQSKKFDLLRPHATPLPPPANQTISPPPNPTN
jgi:hypothetical protein